jgi:hypothetical protein
MIDCAFRTETGCTHISAGVGLPIVVTEDVCAYCIKNYPDPLTRHESYPVLNIAWGERRNRGLEVGPIPLRPGDKPVGRQVQAGAARPTVKLPPAPVVTDPEARLLICEDCDRFDSMGRCKAKCSCTKRPRPLATEGADCPLAKWRRG